MVRDSVCEFMLTMAERLRPKPSWPRRPAEASQDEATLSLAESEALARPFGFVAADLIVLTLKGRLRGCPQASPPDLGAIRFPASALRLLLRRQRARRRV